MWPRLSIVAGLLAGVAVAGLVLGGLVLMGPVPTAPPQVTPVPSVAIDPGASASPSAASSASPSVAASGSPSAAPGSPSAVPIGSASPSSAASAAASGSPPASLATFFHIGEPAPKLSLPKVGGGTIDLAALKGTPVWLDFMGTDCASCQAEFPLMDGFASRYAKNGLTVVVVDVGEDEATVKALADKLRTTFPILLDKDGAVADAWGAYALPVHYWIDKEGIVRDGALGAIGPDVMARGVASILPGVDVQP